MIKKYNKDKKEQSGFNAFIQWIWRLFISIRLAVILLLIITSLSLLGALLIQAPPQILNDPQAYTSWVETAARSKVGIWTPILSALGLFNVFRSPWFISACALLMLNILLCTLNRWNNIKLSIRGGKVRQAGDFYLSGKTTGEIKNIGLPVTHAVMMSERVLRKKGYRIRTETDKDNAYIAADKNRYFKIGTYFSHFSLILFVLAFVASSYFGFSEQAFSVAEDSLREVGYNTGLSLRLNSFTDEYYDNGSPKDFRSEVILYQDGQPVRQAVIQVNRPLVYKGIRFYQSYFGPAAKMQVRDGSGQDVFSGGVAFDKSFDLEGVRRYEGFIVLDYSTDISHARIISTASNADDQIIPPGHVAVDVRNVNNEQIDFKLVKMGIPVMVGGMEFTFLGEAQYSGFQVRSDPASIIIWIASALFIIGICAVFYFPFRQAWVLFKPNGKENCSLSIRTRSPRGFRSNLELNSIIDEIKKLIKHNS